MTEKLEELLQVRVDIITSGAPSERFLAKALLDAKPI